MLPLLLGLEVESRQSAEVLLADGLVDGGAAPDALAVVVCRVGPPVGLHLHVPQDHVFHGGRQTGHLGETQAER